MAIDMVRPGVRTLLVALTMGAAIAACVFAHAKQSNPPKRARPPKWSADVLDAFFADARDKLEGTRPDYGQAKASLASTSDDSVSSKPGDETAVGDRWSKLIDAETIETEIKRLAQSLAKDVTTPGAFKGGGYKACRRSFSLLAVLFGVAADYNGEVRWKEVAAGLRSQFARAGYNCKVGTDQTYQEAAKRKQDLTDLVNGSRPQVPQAETKVANWAEISDRTPLMQRLNAAHQERLTKWLANEREFAAHRDDVHHEAQIVAMIADVIGREGFEFWDDETYAGFARELKQSATDIAAAAERGNYKQAQQAIARVTKACADCHDGYRG
jgi:Cytochrome C'